MFISYNQQPTTNNQQTNNQQPISTLKKKDQKALLYSFIMLIGGVGVYRLPNMSGPYVGLLSLLISSFLFLLASIAIGLVIKLVRRIFKPNDEQFFSKAFWLDTVEEGFAVWCWLVVAILFRYFQLLYRTGQIDFW